MPRFSVVPLILLISLAAGACGTLHNLAPETAASRISSYDSYKEEACEVMRQYVGVMDAMEWTHPRPIAYIPDEEVDHFTQVFAKAPEITCRVKSGKYLFDLTGRKFYEILIQLRELQKAHQHIIADVTDRCGDCLLPNYPISNSYLGVYYRQPVFDTFRDKHMELFDDMCLDAGNLEESEPLIRIHDKHVWPPSMKNPLYPSHSGCPEIWKAALQAQYTRCSRYTEAERYIICPDVVWDTGVTPTRPFAYPKRYSYNKPFHGGFVLRVQEGFDVYWQTKRGVLSHETIPADANESPKLSDVDGNGTNDFNAGGVLFLGQRDGTAIRMTVADYNREQSAHAADKHAKNAASLQGDWLQSLSLFQVEELLSTSQIRNPFLLRRAMKLSSDWWRDTGETSDSLHEKTRIYWHALLWATAGGGSPLNDEFLTESASATETDGAELRLKRISQAYSQGANETIASECDLLQSEVDTGTRIAEDLAEGTDEAEQEIGKTWRLYLNQDFPGGRFAAAKTTREAVLERVAPEIKNLCKRN